MVESVAEGGLVSGGVQTGGSGVGASCSAGGGFGGGASSISQSDGASLSNGLVSGRTWHVVGFFLDFDPRPGFWVPFPCC